MRRYARPILIVCLTLFFISFYYLFFSAADSNASARVELFINEKLHKIQANRIVLRDIAVFVAIEKREDLQTEYRLAFRTLQCYCAANKYPLEVVDLSGNASLWRLCPQKDFMFRRHCVLANWLRGRPDVKWALFTDADMAVVNPHHHIEKFLPKSNVDMVFYERIFNGEIAAGSYLAKNTDFTIRFLHFWADYYSKLPWSWHGTDNGAIHAVFLDKFCTGNGEGQQCSTRREICWKLWRSSSGDDDLRMFTDCVRSVLGRRNVYAQSNGTVQLQSDYRGHWARDGWLTEGKWCSRDFLLHGWKKKWQNSANWGGWESPFTVEEEQLDRVLELGKCSSQTMPKWPYNSKFIATVAELDQKLGARLHEMRMTQLDYWRRIEEYALQQLSGL